jgi:hypothetical protein
LAKEFRNARNGIRLKKSIFVVAVEVSEMVSFFSFQKIEVALKLL